MTTVAANLPRESPPQPRASARIPDRPLFTVEISDRSIGLEGYVCIHSMGKNGASGGMRCLPDVSRGEVEELARAMTYKYSFFKIDLGGAKAGLKISYEEEPERRSLLIREAARHLEPLIKKEVWCPWSDMNFYGPDLVEFHGAIGNVYRPLAGGGSSFRTAVSAFAALRASAELLAIELPRLRVTIEGFGSVACFLAPFLKRSGVKLVALSTHTGGKCNPDGLDLDAVVALRNQAGKSWDDLGAPARSISRAQLFDIETDILIPCARVHSIDEELARKINARLILPIANVPCTERALRVLDERGIGYVPDYVVNGGGVCGHIMGGATVESPLGADNFIEVFGQMVLRMLRRSQALNIPARQLADWVAHENFEAISGAAYLRPTARSRLLGRLKTSRFGPRFLKEAETRASAERTMKHLAGLFT